MDPEYAELTKFSRQIQFIASISGIVKNMIYFIYCNYLWQTNRMRFTRIKGGRAGAEKSAFAIRFCVLVLFYSLLSSRWCSWRGAQYNASSERFSVCSGSVCSIRPLFAYQIDHLRRVESAAEKIRIKHRFDTSTFKFNPLLFQSLRPSVWIVSTMRGLSECVWRWLCTRGWVSFSPERSALTSPALSCGMVFAFGKLRRSAAGERAEN